MGGTGSTQRKLVIEDVEGGTVKVICFAVNLVDICSDKFIDIESILMTPRYLGDLTIVKLCCEWSSRSKRG